MARSWYANAAARQWSSGSAGQSARDFHRTLPGYAPTPLVDLPSLATELRVGRLLVKDESSRLGLPAFKVLGASWACKQVLERQPGAHLVTATDGNHGRAVAHLARHFGVGATVFVNAVMLEHTAGLIASEGAKVVRIDGDYDAAVRIAAQYADGAKDRALVQDTAWPGYEEVPSWIVEGYATLLEEVDDTLDRAPDLVAVPVGVGSLAQSVVTYYRRPAHAHAPAPAVSPASALSPAHALTPTRVLSVEADTAACMVVSLTAGEPITVPTGCTVMAGLNCGTVSSLAWPVMKNGCDAAVTVADEEAQRASADLFALGLSSGTCGAATLAGVRAALGDAISRADLDLPDNAVVVLLSTEGA